MSNFSIKKSILYTLIMLCASSIIRTEQLSQQPNIKVSENISNISEATVPKQNLETTIERSFKSIVAIQNTIIQITMLLQKYGKITDRKADAVKELQELMPQFDGFIQLQIKPIAHYFQQDPNTIPIEAQQEIYGALDTILRTSNELLNTLKKQIKNNFIEPINLDFLITKSTHLLSDEPLNPDAILQYANTVIQNCADVHLAGTSIGLTKWNKAARVIDRYVVQPCGRYHIPKIVGIGGFAVFATLFFSWITVCEQYESPREIKEHERNLAILEQNSSGETPRTAVKRFKNAEQDKVSQEHVTWFTRFMRKWLGKVPCLVNGRWIFVEASKEDLTVWNQTICALYNTLPGANPITNLIGTGVGFLVSTYGVPVVWPFITHSTKNWWQNALGGASAEMAPSGTWEYEPRVILDNVIGLKHIKDYFAPAIAYAENPEKYAQSADSIPTNYILYGLRRTGKSFFAEAIAGTMKMLNPRIRTLNVPCHAFREHGVQQTIDLIRSFAPCVVFIDEVDLGNFARNLDRAVTAELLKALGHGNISPDPSRPVFLFFATNKLEAIDTSLASLGRFGPSILFTNPNFIDRLQFTFIKLKSSGLNPQNFDLNRIAEKTEGNSLEEIAHCITLAKQKALTRNEIISTEMILTAINEILYGIYPEFPIELHKDAINVLSTHFAGKALIAALTESNDILDTVSICRRKLPIIEDENAAFSGKPTRQPKYNYGIMLTRKDTVTENNASPAITKAYYMRILAGIVAEEIVLGKATNQCHAEPWNEDSVAAAYVAAFKECSDGGIYWYLDSQLGNLQKEKYFAKVEAFIEEHKQAARALLEQHRRALDVIIRALKIFGTIHDGVVLSIIENPEAVSAQIDAIEKQQEEEYKRRVAEQEAAQAA